MLESRLARHGFSIVACHYGRDGLAAVSSETVDVIQTALKLPDTNGIELCREISTKWPEIPVVIM